MIKHVINIPWNFFISIMDEGMVPHQHKSLLIIKKELEFKGEIDTKSSLSSLSGEVLL